MSTLESISVDVVKNGYSVRVYYRDDPDSEGRSRSHNDIYVAYNGADLDQIILKLKEPA